MALDLLESITEQPLFRTYAFYASVLALKVLAMSIYTGYTRTKNLAFANPEDAALKKVKPQVNENVERIRRAHLNDLENILVFFVVALVYLTTNPSVFLATTLIRLFTVARLAHTFVYAIVVIPQPARALSFGVGYIITIFMAVSSILHYLV